MERKGFTLIELLIVVLIIGVLAGIAITKYSNTKGRAIVATMKADLRNYATAEESYYSSVGTYGDLTGNTVYFRASGGNTLTSGMADGTHWEATVANPSSTVTCVLGRNTST